MVFGQPKFKDKYVHRKLGERSHLIFEFPQNNGRTIQSYLPMLENCSVMENTQANLPSYDLLGRYGNLFAYTGAKSRAFNIKFNLTLLHILESFNLEGLNPKFDPQFNLFWEDKEIQQKMFTETGPEDPVIPKSPTGMDQALIHRLYYQKVANLLSSRSVLYDEVKKYSIVDLVGDDSPFLDENNKEQFKELNKVLNLVVFWINLIRSSVMNNSKDTTLGPPIVRLQHGILYNNVPCVTESYNIRIVDGAGYDVHTLLPKQVEITMNLKEVRTGDFGEFEATKIIDGDNNTGWESIITDGNIDPYNGEIS